MHLNAAASPPPLAEMPQPDLAPRDVPEIAGRLLRLLADPTRRRIFLMLLRGETCNCELADGLALAENLISHHVRQLRKAGLVRERRDPEDARWVHYRIDAEAYGVAWSALASAVDPARIETRSVCAPTATRDGS
jgi:DNA-binding transcriptional ArsR family regulator